MRIQYRSFSCEIAGIVLTAIIAIASWVIWSNWPIESIQERNNAAVDPNERVGDAWDRAWEKRRDVEGEPW